MKCKKCGEKVILQSSKGGYSVPGYFFLINILLLITILTLYTLSSYIWTSVAGIILVIGLLANLTSYINCSIETGKDGQAKKGRICRNCGHINTVYPWST